MAVMVNEDIHPISLINKIYAYKLYEMIVKCKFIERHTFIKVKKKFRF